MVKVNKLFLTTNAGKKKWVDIEIATAGQKGHMFGLTKGSDYGVCPKHDS